MIFYAIESGGRDDLLSKRRRGAFFPPPKTAADAAYSAMEIFRIISERVNFMYDIDLQSRTPIYEQLYKKVSELILKGELNAGDKLPSVRELAKELGVNPNTVSKAFQLLERDKVIYSLAGRGSFVSNAGTETVRETALADFDKAVCEALKAGIPKKELAERIDKIGDDTV